MNHGPLTKTKGKLGGVVFQQYEGMQVAREYQPVVKNPQSTKQVENRAKFKLSSQIVAQFKEVLSARLSKLSNYERMRRAAAVNAIYMVVDDSTPSTPQALINNVVVAINAKSLSGYAAPTYELVGNDLKLGAMEGDTVVSIVCTYDATKGELVGRYYQSFEAGENPLTITSKDATRQVCMAVALSPITEDGRATISNITANATSWQNEIARSIAAGDIEVSQLASYVLPPSA